MIKSYWHPMPNMPTQDVPGKLIVLEGTDGVGRSTQINMLKTWLESAGVAVFDTGLTRSILAGRHLQRAKEGHTMGSITQALFYATDFADRFENEMLPALKAGCVVLTDRYIYSLMARAIARGNNPDWIRQVYGFAAVPDLVLYLDADLEALIPRVLAAGGFDYWESGVDYCQGDSRYDCFVQHQRNVLSVFRQMIEEYDFVVVDANRPVTSVFADLRKSVEQIVADLTPNATETPTPVQGFVAPTRSTPADARRDISDIISDLLSSLQDE